MKIVGEGTNLGRDLAIAASGAVVFGFAVTAAIGSFQQDSSSEFDYRVTYPDGGVEIEWGPIPRGSYKARCVDGIVADQSRGDVPGSGMEGYKLRFLSDEVCLGDNRITEDEIPPALREKPATPPEKVVS